VGVIVAVPVTTAVLVAVPVTVTVTVTVAVSSSSRDANGTLDTFCVVSQLAMSKDKAMIAPIPKIRRKVVLDNVTLR
jgi:hypothetical protein